MISDQQLQALDPQVRQAMLARMAEIAAKSEELERGRREVAHKPALIDKLAHENALLKRLMFAAQSEKFTAEPAGTVPHRVTCPCFPYHWFGTFRRDELYS